MARDITKLHPFVRMLAEELVRRCAKNGLQIKITDCVRSREEQNGLSSNVTSVRYPCSYHNYGLAFDFCRNDGKGAYNESDNFFYKVGEIGSELGLEWGGYWTNPQDKPHFQFDGFSENENRISIVMKKYGMPEKFFKSADFKWNNPIIDITPSSAFKKILWVQVRLNIHNVKCDMDGVWGKETEKAVKQYWRNETGKTCTGKRISVKCIKMLAENPK